MKFSVLFSATISHLFISFTLAAPGQDAGAQHPVVETVKASLDENGRHAAPRFTPQQVLEAIHSADGNRFCDDVMNVTLTVPSGSVTFIDGYLKADRSLPPTIWSITRDSSSNTFQIGAVDIIDRSIYLVSSSGRVQVDASDFYRFNLKTSPITEKEKGDGLVIHNDYGCLVFNSEGDAFISPNSACTILKMTQVGEPVAWVNPSKKSDKCAANILQAIQDEAEALAQRVLTGMHHGDVEPAVIPFGGGIAYQGFAYGRSFAKGF